jgi:predicted NAD/FAD-dependent oxidoreductase
VVDLGASYFTVSDPQFELLVNDWQRRGLVRPWTQTFLVADSTGPTGHTSGPMRWAAGDAGLRGLVEDLAARLGNAVTVDHPFAVAGLAPEAAGGWRVVDESGSHHWTGSRVALCMPPPQAAALLDPESALAERARDYTYEPILALVAQWPRRVWDDFDACFVNGDSVLSFVADDGSRRADGAAVLVAHSTPEFARAHLEDPSNSAPALIAALRGVFGLPEPLAADVKRWSLARPTGVHPQVRDQQSAAASPPDTPSGVRPETPQLTQPLGYLIGHDATIGIASDAFDRRPRIEAAWQSGRHVGTVLGSALQTA